MSRSPITTTSWLRSSSRSAVDLVRAPDSWSTWVLRALVSCTRRDRMSAISAICRLSLAKASSRPLSAWLRNSWPMTKIISTNTITISSVDSTST